jgi:hypothetical protein
MASEGLRGGLRETRVIPDLDYADLAIAMAVAAAAPLLVELLPLPKAPPIVTEIVAGVLPRAWSPVA